MPQSARLTAYQLGPLPLPGFIEHFHSCLVEDRVEMIVLYSFAAFLLLAVTISAVFKEVRRSARRRKYLSVPPEYRHLGQREAELMELIVLLNGQQSCEISALDLPPSYEDCFVRKQIV